MITYATENLSRRVYNRLIRRIVWEIFGHDSTMMMWFLEYWEIEIFSTDDVDLQYFEHYKTTDGQAIRKGIPSGATGQRVMTLWLNDKKGDFYLRQNANVIGHELNHAVLLETQGTANKNWVKWVHEETRRFSFRFWYWQRFWTRTQISLIDIRHRLH